MGEPKSETNLDEVQEVGLRLTRRELADIKQFLGTERMMGNFLPEDNPVQMVAVKVLVAAGLLKVQVAKSKRKSKRV
jgi:hypothetical protein